MRTITDADVIRWKDALVANGLKSKTIKNSYLGCLRAIFNFAVENKLISKSPAENVKVAYRKNSEQRQLPYSDEEVARLLRLAKQQTNPARRWLPWLAALSGARIGELAQLWAEGIKIENGIHFMEIKAAPDGGSLKTPNSERRVPLHPILIKDGFLDFVKTKGKGPLFYQRSSATRTNDMHRKVYQIIWRHGSENKGFAIHERLQTMRFAIGGNQRRRVSVCKIASPTPSKDMQDIPLHRPTGTSIWKLWIVSNRVMEIRSLQACCLPISAAPTRSKDIPELLVHQPTGTSIWKNWQ